MSADDAPYDVLIHDSLVSEYTAALYAGLYELRERGRITLRHAPVPGRLAGTPVAGIPVAGIPVAGIPAPPRLYSLWLTARNSAGEVLRLCLETRDGPRLDAPEAPDLADICLQRAYVPDFAASLGSGIAGKFLPLGLYYACRSRYETLSDTVRTAVRAGRLQRGWVHRVAVGTAHGLLRSLRTRPPLIDSLEGSAANRPAEAVFFRTRVYAPQDAPASWASGELERINESRAATVRALRRALGSRFHGGLRPSSYARHRYPDCVIGNDPGRLGHIAQTRSHLVNVSTAGLHGSTGWKLPEILASGTCAVCEPLLHRLPEPLVPGRHFMAFRSPDECAEVCERLLSDSPLAAHVRAEGARYYRDHVRPDKLMDSALRRAFDRAGRLADSRTRP